MRYVRVEVDGRERVGVVEPEDTLRLFPAGTDLLTAATAAESPACDAETLTLDGVRLLPPVRPASFRDFVAFEEHVQGAAAMTGNAEAAIAAWYQQPTYLYGSPHAVVGPGDPVAAPPG